MPKPLNLDAFLDPTYVPKKVIARQKKPTGPVAKRYRPTIFPPDPTPEAVVTFWSHFHCQCGMSWEAPKFTGDTQFVRRRLKDGTYEHVPLHSRCQRPDLPRILVEEHVHISSCRSCHTRTDPPPPDPYEFREGEYCSLAEAQRHFYRSLLKSKPNGRD